METSESGEGTAEAAPDDHRGCSDDRPPSGDSEAIDHQGRSDGHPPQRTFPSGKPVGRPRGKRGQPRKLNYETGLLDLSPDQAEFLNWLCGEREPGDSEGKWAERHGYHKGTPQLWKRDSSFRAHWDIRMRRSHASPDVINTHLAALNEKAKKGDTTAIKLYHDIVEKMWPEKLEAIDVDVRSLSDDELAEIAQGILDLRSSADADDR